MQGSAGLPVIRNQEDCKRRTVPTEIEENFALWQNF